MNILDYTGELLVLHTTYRGAAFLSAMKRVGAKPTGDGKAWVAPATRATAEEFRRAMGKGLAVSPEASAWYRQATA